MFKIEQVGKCSCKHVGLLENVAYSKPLGRGASLKKIF
jgi:hypothetical protein